MRNELVPLYLYIKCFKRCLQLTKEGKTIEGGTV